jgi:pimeloyl-ACP methyl ester carboxylesterase
MRGFGKSDPVDAVVSRRDELYRLLKHLGVESAYMVGCSMGGETMIDFAIEHPEMVSALITVNSTPSGFEMQGEPPAEILAMIEAMQKGDLDRVSELQLRVWIDGPFRQPEEVDAQVRQRAAQMNQIAVRNQTWALADARPADPLLPPAVQQLQNVHAPTLVMVGALDHPEILRAADVLAEGIAGAQKAIVPGSAHVPSMEKPTEFNRIVLAFLQRVD